MIAAAIGLSRWKTPLDAYLDVRQEVAPEEVEGENIDRGSFLEPSLLAWTAKKTGIAFTKPHDPIDPKQPLVLTDPRNEWFTFSPDGIAGTRIAEIKAPGPRSAFEWGESGVLNDSGDARVPQEYMLQGVWGMMVAQASECVFAALIGGELRTYRMMRDLDLEAKVRAKAEKFITEHVLTGTPPPATYGDGDTLRRLYPSNEKPAVEWKDLTTIEQGFVADFLRLHAVQKQAKEELERYEAFVQEIIKDRAGIVKLPPDLGYERIDWKSRSPSMHAGSYKEMAEALLKEKTPAEQKIITERHMPKEGGRPLVPYKLSKKAKLK